jgi:hypothetical protein
MNAVVYVGSRTVGFARALAGIIHALGAIFLAQADGGERAKVTCLLCGSTLTAEGYCERCQLTGEQGWQVFRAQRLEESRTPCGVLVVLALVALVAAVVWLLWVVL